MINVLYILSTDSGLIIIYMNVGICVLVSDIVYKNISMLVIADNMFCIKKKKCIKMFFMIKKYFTFKRLRIKYAKFIEIL